MPVRPFPLLVGYFALAGSLAGVKRPTRVEKIPIDRPRIYPISGVSTGLHKDSSTDQEIECRFAGYSKMSYWLLESQLTDQVGLPIDC